MKRKPKTERQKIIKANDDLFRELIRRRDKVCQKTGKTTRLQVCHFYSRSRLRVRWEPDNACLLNAGVHKFWAHKEPYEFKDFWMKRLGTAKFAILELRARYAAPVKMYDLLGYNRWLRMALEMNKQEDIEHDMINRMEVI